MTSRWPLVALGEVLTQDRNYIDRPDPLLYPKLSVKLYGRGVVLDTPTEGVNLRMQRHQLAKAGQVILSEIWGKKGAIGIVPPEGNGALCTSHFFLFDIRRDRVEPGYLQALFSSNYLEQQLDSEARGTTGYAAVRPQHLLAARAPLPPLHEQRRLVARIAEISTRVAEVGELISDCDRRYDAVVESGLSRVFDDLRNQYGAKRLESLILDARYGTSVKCDAERDDGAVPVFRIPNVIGEELNMADLKYAKVDQQDLARLSVVDGDLLMVRTNGSINLVGRCAVSETLPETFLFASYLIRFRCDRSMIHPRFLQLMLKHLRAKGVLVDLARTTAGQFNVSIGRIKEAMIPVPPVEEQTRLVRFFEDLRLATLSIKRLGRERASKADAIRLTIVARAFAGEF